MIFTSGECEIDLTRRELRVRGVPVPIGGRPFEILEILAQSAGVLITKDELMNRVWPGATVMEGTLHVHAVAIRKALGPLRTLLKTESRRGYRLLGDWALRRQDAPSRGLRGDARIQYTSNDHASRRPIRRHPEVAGSRFRLSGRLPDRARRDWEDGTCAGGRAPRPRPV